MIFVVVHLGFLLLLKTVFFLVAVLAWQCLRCTDFDSIWLLLLLLLLFACWRLDHLCCWCWDSSRWSVFVVVQLLHRRFVVLVEAIFETGLEHHLKTRFLPLNIWFQQWFESRTCRKRRFSLFLQLRTRHEVDDGMLAILSGNLLGAELKNVKIVCEDRLNMRV